MTKLVASVFFAAIFCVAQAVAQPATAVLTWHDDNLRTGWQQYETVLTTQTVSKLGISHSVTLLAQVDAQVLVIPSFINGHDVAFVADESNNVYQIDASVGAIIKQVNLGASLGPPVPHPLGCRNTDPTGINSTPVIDWASQTLFVIAYIEVNGTTPTYFVHALDLMSLADKVAPVKVVASHVQTDGTIDNFNATVQRQRAGLLFANGNVYAGFSSFCDFHVSASRGWLLGWAWNASLKTLTALPANQLNDRQSGSNFYLSSIWMSGAGPAADETGNLVFATGNSDGPHATTSTWVDTTPCQWTATGSPPTSVPCSNIQESVVKLTGDLTTIVGLFSPNAAFGVFSPNTLQLDQHDTDLGAGGVLLVPPQGVASLALAAVAGKDGRLFLFDRAAKGPNGLKFLEWYQAGGSCWCAPSYFTGSDGVGRIVTSYGKHFETFQVPTTSLSPEGKTTISTGQDGGFFTTVSCNGGGAFGSCKDTPIIWAVSRPISSTSTGVNLYAFSSLPVKGSYPLLFGPTQVGSWPNTMGNANIVPTVSNGLIYVASNKLLTILKEGGAAALPLAEAAAPPTSAFAISGTLHSVYGSVLTLTNRHGKDRLIDASKAIANEQVAAALTTGEAYTAVGSSLTSAGVLLADAIYRAKCRQHSDVEEDQMGTPPACTGDQWPPDKDPRQ